MLNAKFQLMGPHPEARLIAWLTTLIGVFVASNVMVLTMGWALLLAMLWRNGQLWRHLAIVGTIVIPLGVALAIVWGMFVGAPPGAVRGSAPELGFMYAATVALRLAIITGVSQVAFLTIPPEALWPAARRLGLRGTPLVIVLSSVALASGMARVVDQTLSALIARGAIRPDRPLTKITVLPTVIANLWNRLIADQMQRVEYKWAPQKTLERVARIDAKANWSKNGSVLVIAAGFAALSIALWSAFNG